MKTYYPNAIVEWSDSGKVTLWATYDSELSCGKAVEAIAFFLENYYATPLIAWIDEFEDGKKTGIPWMKCYIDTMGHHKKWTKDIVSELKQLATENAAHCFTGFLTESEMIKEEPHDENS